MFSLQAKLQIAAVAVIALASPLAASTDRGLELNNACAADGARDGSCCWNERAICGLNGENYGGWEYHNGPCPKIDPQ